MCEESTLCPMCVHSESILLKNYNVYIFMPFYSTYGFYLRERNNWGGDKMPTKSPPIHVLAMFAIQGVHSVCTPFCVCFTLCPLCVYTVFYSSIFAFFFWSLTEVKWRKTVCRKKGQKLSVITSEHPCKSYLAFLALLLLLTLLTYKL